MCQQVPFCIGTDCKSLYDLCNRVGTVPDDKRCALDLLDVREGVEEFKDQVRWVPTDHMLADAFTKNMPPDLLMRYLKDYVYSFKYDDEIKNTKREVAKARKEQKNLPKQESGSKPGQQQLVNGKPKVAQEQTASKPKVCETASKPKGILKQDPKLKPKSGVLPANSKQVHKRVNLVV